MTGRYAGTLSSLRVFLIAALLQLILAQSPVRGFWLVTWNELTNVRINTGADTICSAIRLALFTARS
jgi:hypothetical protein